MRPTGVLPNPYDLRDYSAERTFGTLDPKVFPLEYNADLGLDFPDQNKDGFYNGCTGYTQTETGQDEYGVPFYHPFLYKKTLLYANLPDGYPVKIRDSFKATSIYGLLPRNTNDESKAYAYKRGKYFDVDKVGDYFDGVRSAMQMQQLHHRTVSAGAPWMWDNIPNNGIMPDFQKKKIPAVYHNFKICGWKTIKNEPYLIVKAWCGKNWGDDGYGYMSRAVFNKLIGISGTFLYIQANADVSDVQRIKLDILEFIVDLYRRLMSFATPTPPPLPIPAPTPVPAPPVPVPAPVEPKPNLVWDTPENARKSVRIICDEEKLSLSEKNLICAVIMGESGFKNTAKNFNKNAAGVTLSTDWGICQINDHYHIGTGKTFPSVAYVLENPDKVVRWMIKMYRAGHLNWWIAYKSGAYKKYLP